MAGFPIADAPLGDFSAAITDSETGETTVSSNILIATPRLFDQAVLTTPGTVASNLPLSNVQVDLRSRTKCCRFTSLTDTAIVIDMLDAYDINLVWASLRNATADATWRVRAATSEALLTAAPSYDATSSLWSPDAGAPPLYFPSAKSFRWWRIDFYDEDNPNGYLDVARVILDAAFQPNVNREWGGPQGWVDPSTRRLTIGGDLYSTPRRKRRGKRFDLQWLEESEAYGACFDILDERGQTKPVLIVDEPEATTYKQKKAIYGLLGDLQPINDASLGIFAMTFAVEELIVG